VRPEERALEQILAGARSLPRRQKREKKKKERERERERGERESFIVKRARFDRLHYHSRRGEGAKGWKLLNTPLLCRHVS